MERVEILKALAHTTRLYIMETLSGGGTEKCVCELVEELPFAQSTISKHLTILRRAGLVQTHKEGLKVFYRLAHPELKGFLGDLLQLEEKLQQTRTGWR